MRRTKATLIYRRTKNLRAVQLLLGHTKLESTVRYLGIEVDDALEIAEQTEDLSNQGRGDRSFGR
jgi:integrase